MAKKLNSLTLLLSALLMVGCTIEYENQSGDIEKSNEIPDSIMENFKLIQIKNNKPHTVVKAQRAEIYNSN